jgi:hypothetical protein
MAIKIGTTDLSTVGKIKLGSTNVTKVYLGTTQIFPVGSVIAYAHDVKLGNSNASACSATTETVYSADEFFTTGIILYSDALLTTLVSGNRVVDAVTTDIYNLSSGVVGSVVGAC